MVRKELIFAEKVLNLKNFEKQLVANALYQMVNNFRILKQYYSDQVKGTHYSKSRKFFETLEFYFEDNERMLLDLAACIENLKK